MISHDDGSPCLKTAELLWTVCVLVPSMYTHLILPFETRVHMCYLNMNATMYREAGARLQVYINPLMPYAIMYTVRSQRREDMTSCRSDYFHGLITFRPRARIANASY